MVINYLKGSSASIISSVSAYMILTYLFDPHYQSDYFYFFIMYATFIGYALGLIAILIIISDSNKEVFTRKKVAIFSCIGIILGIGLEFLMDFSSSPFFLLATLTGSLMFLVVQKIENKLIAWSIISVHLLVLFLYPYLLNHFFN
ncbi:MAG: hypothetical protein WBF39_05915 [Planococcus donghaensis]